MFEGRKLLLADDSVTIQKVVSLTFADEGLEVTPVGDGALAIEKLPEIMPDIVLADVFMPGRTGYEVCEHVKRNESLRHIPVLLLVGAFEQFDEKEAHRVGADGVVTKPFQSIRQLVSKVRSMLGGGRRAPENDSVAAPVTSATGAGPEDGDISTAPEPAGPAGAEFDEYEAEVPDTLQHRGEAAPSIPIEAGFKPPDDAAPPPSAQLNDPRFDDTFIDAAPAASFISDDGRSETARPEEPFMSQQPVGDEREVDAKRTAEEPAVSGISTAGAAPAEPGHGSPASPGSGSRSGRMMAEAAAADDALLDLGDIEPPLTAIEADDFILDLREEEESIQPGTSAAATDHGEAVASVPAEDFGETTIRDLAAVWAQAVSSSPAVDAAAGVRDLEPEKVSGETAPHIRHEESIDIPTLEAVTAQPAASQIDISSQTEPQTSHSEADARPAATAMTAGDGRREGLIGLDQLAPEVIDAIARRAVEMLSEKVVEQIAWEVVPQLAELMIKRHLEQEGSRTGK